MELAAASIQWAFGKLDFALTNLANAPEPS
jgi:hypothetical protein